MKRITVIALLLASTIAAADPVAQTLARPEVKLLDAGHGAKQQLRVRATRGTSQTLVMAMKMSMAIEGALSIPAMQLPVMTMSMPAKVTEVTKSGDVKYDISFAKVDVDGAGAAPAVVEAVKKSTQQLVGTSGHLVVDARNFTTAAEMNFSPNIDPTIRQMMDSMLQSFSQLSAPFPEEAVGVGAKWQVTSQIPAGGVVLKQTVTYTLTALDANRMTASVSLAQKADPQAFTGPTVPAGVKMRVVTWSGMGTGDLTFEFAKVLATHAALDMSSVAKMTIDAGSGPQDIKYTIGAKIDMR